MDTQSLQTDGSGATPRGVTVIVPTYKRSAHLVNCLRDLVAQTYRPLEVLVVDQADRYEGEAYEFSAAHPDIIRYDVVTFRGLPQARNYGWQNARYDAIVYLDDDTRFTPSLVEEHVRALSLPGVGVVAGGVDEPNRPLDMGPPTGEFSIWTARERGGFAANFEGYVRHAKGCNYSTWRKVIQEVGGTDEGLSPAASMFEDLEFSLRAVQAGYHVYFDGKARVTHLAADTGGCRLDDFTVYLRGLTRNRTVIIRRHLKWYQKWIALAWQARQVAGFARSHRSPRLLLAGLSGFLQGWLGVSRKPLCTTFGPGSLVAAPAASDIAPRVENSG